MAPKSNFPKQSGSGGFGDLSVLRNKEEIPAIEPIPAAPTAPHPKPGPAAPPGPSMFAPHAHLQAPYAHLQPHLQHMHPHMHLQYPPPVNPSMPYPNQVPPTQPLYPQQRDPSQYVAKPPAPMAMGSQYYNPPPPPPSQPGLPPHLGGPPMPPHQLSPYLPASMMAPHQHPPQPPMYPPPMPQHPVPQQLHQHQVPGHDRSPYGYLSGVSPYGQPIPKPPAPAAPAVQPMATRPAAPHQVSMELPVRDLSPSQRDLPPHLRDAPHQRLTPPPPAPASVQPPAMQPRPPPPAQLQPQVPRAMPTPSSGVGSQPANATPAPPGYVPPPPTSYIPSAREQPHPPPPAPQPPKPAPQYEYEYAPGPPPYAVPAPPPPQQYPPPAPLHQPGAPPAPGPAHSSYPAAVTAATRAAAAPYPPAPHPGYGYPAALDEPHSAHPYDPYGPAHSSPAPPPAQPYAPPAQPVAAGAAPGYVYPPASSPVPAPTGSPTSNVTPESKKLPILDSKTRVPLEIKPTTPTAAEPRERKPLVFKDPKTRQELPVYEQQKTKALPIKDPLTRKVIEVGPASDAVAANLRSTSAPAQRAAAASALGEALRSVGPTTPPPLLSPPVPASPAPSPVIAASTWTASNPVEPMAVASALQVLAPSLSPVSSEPTGFPALPAYHVGAPPPAVPYLGHPMFPVGPPDGALALPPALSPEELMAEEGFGLAGEQPENEMQVDDEEEEQPEEEAEEPIQEEEPPLAPTPPPPAPPVHDLVDEPMPDVQNEPEGEAPALEEAEVAAEEEAEQAEDEEGEEGEEEEGEGEDEEEEEEEAAEAELEGNHLDPTSPKDTWGYFVSIGSSPAGENGLPKPALPAVAKPAVEDLTVAEAAPDSPALPPKEGEGSAWRGSSRPRTPSPPPGHFAEAKPKPAGVSGYTPLDAVVLAPRASWGHSVAVAPAKKALPDGAGNLRDEALKGSPTEGRLAPPSSAGGRRIYTREQLKALESTGTKPPERLKKMECYAEAQRPIRVPPAPDARSLFQTQKVTPPSVQAFNQLDGKKAEVAFNVQNARQVDTQLKIVQKVRGILNRITKQTYDVLSEEMWGLLSTHKLMESPEMLERVVDTIFDVALTQANFGSLAADICLFVCNKIKNLKQQVVEGEETPIATPLQEFRRILLNKCQNMFDSSCDHVAGVAPDTASEEEREAIAAKEKKFRMMSLANITFMAQLFNRSLLSDKIMHQHVIARLLQKDHTDDRNSWLLEFLVKLMELTGKRLDKDYVRTYMDSYFSQLDTISRTHPDTRLRHLTFNLGEMRRAGWRTREEVKASNESLQGSRARAADWEAAQANLKKVDEPPVPKKKGGGNQQQPGSKKEGKAAKAAAAKEAALPKAAAPKAAAPPAPEPVAALTEEQQGKIDSVAKANLQEWTENDLSEEDVTEQVKKEVVPQHMSHFVAAMVLSCVTSNKLQAQRDAFPKLASVLVRGNVTKPAAMREAFVRVTTSAVAQETWVDVPKLWANLAPLVAACIAMGLVDFEVLQHMAVPFFSEEEYVETALEFLLPVLQALDDKQYEGFDAEKAGRLLAAVQKGKGKGKGKAKKGAKPATLAELVEALEKTSAAP